LAAALPEGFLLLLATGLVFGLVNALRIVGSCRRAFTGRGIESLKPAAFIVAQSRQALVVWATALLPAAFVMVQGSTLYDGMRHVLFLIPILAVIASYGFVRLLPFLRRVSIVGGPALGGGFGFHVGLLP